MKSFLKKFVIDMLRTLVIAVTISVAGSLLALICWAIISTKYGAPIFLVVWVLAFSYFIQRTWK